MMAPADDREDGNEPLFAEINVTPFVDVMLVLLVVFMVAAPLLVKGIPLELPRNAGRTLGKPASPLVISLTRDGVLFVQDDRVAMPDLDGRLTRLHAEQPDAVVYVRADRGVPYGDVTDVLGRLSDHGLTHVSLLSRTESPRN
jgi:biopolymer transport protein TolR